MRVKIEVAQGINYYSRVDTNCIELKEIKIMRLKWFEFLKEGPAICYQKIVVIPYDATLTPISISWLSIVC